MNLLVTGATGHLCSTVTAGLLAGGPTVRAHARSTTSADRIPAGVEAAVNTEFPSIQKEQS